MPQDVQPVLNTLLADYQVLYQKLRNYHWNVRGPMFFELHAKFEELYDEAALRVDEIAERVGTLGGRPISTLAGALEKARLKEDPGQAGPQEMVANLVADYERLNGHLREASRKAEKAGDAGTFNLLEGFADSQEKTVWMLKAYLG